MRDDDIDEVNQDDPDQQAVELSIVILVDGDEKCSSRVGSANSVKTSQGVRGTSSFHKRPECRHPECMKSPSATSLPANNKKIVIGPICMDKRERRARSVGHEYQMDECGNYNQPQYQQQPVIIPTLQSTCPCASLRNLPGQEAASNAYQQQQRPQTCQSTPQPQHTCQSQPKPCCQGGVPHKCQPGPCQQAAAHTCQSGSRPCSSCQQKSCQGQTQTGHTCQGSRPCPSCQQKTCRGQAGADPCQNAPQTCQSAGSRPCPSCQQKCQGQVQAMRGDPCLGGGPQAGPRPCQSAQPKTCQGQQAVPPQDAPRPCTRPCCQQKSQPVTCQTQATSRVCQTAPAPQRTCRPKSQPQTPSVQSTSSTPCGEAPPKCRPRTPCTAKSQSSTVACQTVCARVESRNVPCPPPPPSQPCVPRARSKPCKVRTARSAICQTQPSQPEPKTCRPRSRPKTGQPKKQKDMVSASEPAETTEAEEPSRRKKREEPKKEVEQEKEERRVSKRRTKEEEPETEKEERRVSKEKRVSKERRTSKEARRSKEAEEEEEQPQRKKRSSGTKSSKREEPSDARQARKSMLNPQKLNFSHFPTVQLNFVDYFLKTEGGVTSVITLAEAKQEFEKNCKVLLAKVPELGRNQAKEFFVRILETIETKVPDSNNTEISHYHLMKYLQPIVAALELSANQEMHDIQKYHNYILAVVSLMEDKLSNKEVVNPDALVDVETHLLAGIMSRFYPLFIKMEELLVSLSAQKGVQERYPPENVLKQLRKLILAIYVEIICIDVTFTNTLTSLAYLPSADVQERYKHQLALRKKHARHSVTWAARCIASPLLFYYVGSGGGSV